MRIGFAMRQQSIAAVYSKALRLNSSSIADVSPGKVMRLSCLHPSSGCLQSQASLYEQASDTLALECWDDLCVAQFVLAAAGRALPERVFRILLMTRSL